MTDKIRKRLGPVSVVATIAVLGILAAFIALAALPDITSAQNPPPPPPPPSGDGHADAGWWWPAAAASAARRVQGGSQLRYSGVQSDVERPISMVSDSIDVLTGFLRTL